MNYFIKSPIFTVLLLLTSLSAVLGQKVSPKNTSELTGQVLDISNNKGLSFASVTLLKKKAKKRNLQLALLPMKMAISNFRMSHWESLC
jgi:hypothetical protein